ncbi:MAG: hypothetical protein QOJ50_811 [Cryptosporangiaceae bacterium]|nr:hypothetical protein [Cryptosporangiaceae bacterium]
MTGPSVAPPQSGQVTEPDRRAAALSATVLALPVALLAGVGAFAYLGGFSHARTSPRGPATGPVPVTAPPSLASTAAPCAALLNRLPRTLDGSVARPVTDAPDRVVAWGDPAIVLRCGVARPKEATAIAQEFVINGVAWVYSDDHGTGVWTVTKRTVYVEVRTPAKYHGSATQVILNPLADPIAAALPLAPR